MANFDAQAFIRDYWQRQPLLIKGGLAGWDNPLSAEELAGLALETEIESRLVSCVSEPVDNGRAENAHASIEWQLAHGPFTEQQFNDLPRQDWTLLVQAVDHYVPAVAALRDYFTFIPSWQIDDVMVSYATEGGGVGPHFDRYDVFLVQGQGQREWQLGQRCDQYTEQQHIDGLSLLSGFEPQETFILEPGDILYVPPYLAHWGTALDNSCMTYSVGFRAPSIAELIDDYASFLYAELSDDERFREQLDITRVKSQPPTAINPATLAQLGKIMTQAMQDPQQLGRWFGRWASAPKYPSPDSDEPQESLVGADEAQELLASLKSEAFGESQVYRDTACRIYTLDHSANGNGTQSLLLFINGRDIELTAVSETLRQSIALVCNSHCFAAKYLALWLDHPVLSDEVLTLFDRGELYFDNE